jgi:hypothetical protein
LTSVFCRKNTISGIVSIDLRFRLFVLKDASICLSHWRNYLAIDLIVTLFNLSIFYVNVVPKVDELTNDRLVKGLEKDVLLVMSEILDFYEGEKYYDSAIGFFC